MCVVIGTPGEFEVHHPVGFAPGPSFSPRNDHSTYFGVWSKGGFISIILPPVLSSSKQLWEARPQVLLEGNTGWIYFKHLNNKIFCSFVSISLGGLLPWQGLHSVLPCPALQPWFTASRVQNLSLSSLKVLCLKDVTVTQADPSGAESIWPPGTQCKPGLFSLSRWNEADLSRVTVEALPQTKESTFAAVCFTSPPLGNMRNRGLGWVWLLPWKAGMELFAI